MLLLTSGWLGIITALVGLFGLSYVLVGYFSDPRSTHPLSTIVTTLSFTFSLLCLVLIPVDVAAAVYHTHLEANANVIQIVYWAVYGGLALLAYAVVPFAYFYVEDWLQDDDAIADAQSLTKSTASTRGGRYRRPTRGCLEVLSGCCARGCTAMKSTSIFIAAVLVLVVVGVLVQPSTPAESVGFGDRAHLQSKIRDLLDFKSGAAAERALLLTIGVLTAIGVVNFCLYTGFGLAALPVGMVRGGWSQGGGSGGYRSPEDEAMQVEWDRTQLRQQRAALEKKYGKRLASNKEAREQLAKLDATDRAKQRQLQALQALSASSWSRLRRVLVPFRWLIGAVLLIVSGVVCVSLLISLMDRALHSTCGVRCGFALMDDGVANYPSPIDQMLLHLSKYFPFDFVVFACLCLYIFAASLYGLVRLGVRLCVCGCLQLFEVRARRTWSSALLIVSVLMMCILLALMVWLLTLAPQYMTFGAQHYVPSGVVNVPQLPCTLTALSAIHPLNTTADAATSVEMAVHLHDAAVSAVTAAQQATKAAHSCVMTHIALSGHRLVSSVPLLSLLVYVAQWLFLASVSVSGCYESCRDRTNTSTSALVDDDDDFFDGSAAAAAATAKGGYELTSGLDDAPDV